MHVVFHHKTQLKKAVQKELVSISIALILYKRQYIRIKFIYIRFHSITLHYELLERTPALPKPDF